MRPRFGTKSGGGVVANGTGPAKLGGMTLDLRWPFTGAWLTQNSPAQRVPSHGTTLFASAHAIDFVGVDAAGRSAPLGWRALLRPEPPTGFVGFGRPVLAPIDGRVIAVLDEEPDHDAHRGVPSLVYALTQRLRLAQGWPALAGNHVFLSATGGEVVALCHLQRGSVGVRVGEDVRAGEPIARCGNSGNSTEPHLHLQAMDRPDVARARAVPIRFEGALPRNGEVVRI